jgi:type III secretion system YscQ/HrcQ family protein
VFAVLLNSSTSSLVDRIDYDPYYTCLFGEICFPSGDFVRANIECQVTQSAVDKHASQVAQSALDKHASQVAQSAVDKLKLPSLTPSAAEDFAKSFNKPLRWQDEEGIEHSFIYATETFDTLGDSAIELSGARLRMRLVSELDWRMQALDHRAWHDFQDHSKLLAFGLSFEAVIQWFSALFGDEFLPRRVVKLAERDPSTSVCLRYQARHCQQQMLLAQSHIWIMPKMLPLLVERRAIAPPSQPRWAESLPFELSVRLEPLQIAHLEFSEMRIGDVIGLGNRAHQLSSLYLHIANRYHDSSAVPASGDLLLDVDSHPVWLSKVTKAGAKLLHLVHPHLTSHLTITSESIMEPSTTEKLHKLQEQVQIQLDFELERRTITLAELSELQAGYVFKLATPSEGRNVQLLANGRNIGSGELVSVGDFLGVRILEIHS